MMCELMKKSSLQQRQRFALVSRGSPIEAEFWHASPMAAFFAFPNSSSNEAALARAATACSDCLLRHIKREEIVSNLLALQSCIKTAHQK